MIALDVKNICKSFKSHKRMISAVNGLSFEVEDGEVFGLLGINGAGKSTAVKICSGLMTQDSGSVRVFGHDIVKERTAAKSMLNVSPQETAVAPMLSVRENLEFIAEIYGADKTGARKASDEMMERLKLAERANDRAGKLSGGLMRRLSIGMALITEPKLVFLDEPTLGLDIVARRGLWELITELKNSAAVILTTHYLEEAERLCDRIAIMSDGKIAAVGTAEQLIASSGADCFEDAFIKLSGAEESDGNE